MAYLLLGVAIVLEVTGTVALRLSEGFTKPAWGAVVVVTYIGAVALLSRALVAGLPLGIGYAIWAAVGVALVVLVSAVFLGEGLTLVQLAGVVLVIAGVVALELGRTP